MPSTVLSLFGAGAPRLRSPRRHTRTIAAGLLALTCLVSACTSATGTNGSTEPASSGAMQTSADATTPGDPSSVDSSPVGTSPPQPEASATGSTVTAGGSTHDSTTDSGPGTSTTPAKPVAAVLQKHSDPARVVWAKSPQALAIAMSAAMFRTAPAVVLVSGDDTSAVTQASKHAESLHAPLLLASASSTGAADTPLAKELHRLDAHWVLAADPKARAVVDGINGIKAVTETADLPRLKSPASASGVTVLVPADAVKGMTAGIAAARATSTAAGARIQQVHGSDPRNDPKAIEALAEHPPTSVIGLGPDFGPVDRFAARVATAATGVQLPGGGQVMFPGRRLVALYGNPYDGKLGALGQQDLPAAIARAKKVAGEYTKLSKVPVIPSFEIIATVATAGAGPDGDYSAESSVADLKGWMQAATKAGMCVILDLQPGRAHLLDQAKLYTDLLTMPSVGLALDPEWKLKAGQVPLQQIGGVDAFQINQVIDWMAQLTAKHHLPQKVLVLHQFRLSMLRDEAKIDTGNDNVAVLIHMDGQGAPHLKDETWRAVVDAAPKGVWFGWKDFYVKDTPMMTPSQTMAHKPQPLMISYQ